MAIKIEDIIDVIRQANVVPMPENLRSDVNLTDQGIDSLDTFSVILGLQEKYNIIVSDDDVDHLKTIEDMAAYINRTLENK